MHHIGIMLLRPAREADILHIQRIEKTARSRYLGTDRFSFVAETPAIAADRLVEGEVIIAEINGCPVGFVLLVPMDGRVYVANISVDVGFSGRGIGAALLNAAEDFARSQELAALMLTTFRRPRWNGPWFRRLGFVPMPVSEFGPSLQAVLDRHRKFLDMRTRVTLWRPMSPAPRNRAAPKE